MLQSKADTTAGHSHDQAASWLEVRRRHATVARLIDVLSTSEHTAAVAHPRNLGSTSESLIRSRCTNVARGRRSVPARRLRGSARRPRSPRGNLRRNSVAMAPVPDPTSSIRCSLLPSSRRNSRIRCRRYSGQVLGVGVCIGGPVPVQSSGRSCALRSVVGWSDARAAEVSPRWRGWVPNRRREGHPGPSGKLTDPCKALVKSATARKAPR
jgi:hypothetical protein